ncbi:MAG: MFS transporter [Myxococcota bacterium]
MRADGPRLRDLPRALRPLYAGTIATRVGTFVVPYLTLYLSQARGLSLEHTGRVIAASGVGLLLGNLAGGWLTDRLGRKPTLLASLVLNALGMAALGSGLGSPATYGLMLGVASFGGGMYSPAANAWIADLADGPTRRLAYTVNYICINVGMGIGPLLGGLLAALSFRWLFAGDILTTLACAGILLAAAAPTPRSADAADTATDRLPLGVLAFCGASVFIIAPLMGLEYVVPLYVGTVLNEPLVWVGVVYTINATCILGLGLLLERALAGRRPAAMMAVAGLAWCAGLVLLAGTPTIPALLGSTVVWTLGEMIGSVVVPTFVAGRVAEHVRGRALAIPDAMRSVSAIVAPVALGWLWDAHGFDTVMLALIATPALGALLYAGAWSRR